MPSLRLFLATLALSWSVLAGPALAQCDGYDNDADGQVDELDECPGGGNDMGRTERTCDATGEVEVCMMAYTMFCQQFGSPYSCALTQIGNHCYGGDPAQCQYFQALMQAKAACYAQDQASCDWFLSQPVVQLGQ